MRSERAAALLFALLLAASGGAGCRQAERTVDEAAGTLREAYRTPDRVRVQMDLIFLRGQIARFQAEHRRPPSREELDQGQLHFRFDEEYLYDRDSGTISSRSRPEL